MVTALISASVFVLGLFGVFASIEPNKETRKLTPEEEQQFEIER